MRFSHLTGVFLIAGVLAVGSYSWARQAEVVKTNGQVLKGELVKKTADEIILQDSSGIKIKIPNTEVKSFKLLKTIEEEYAERTAALKPDDKEGRYKLAYEMNEKKAYHLAEKELVGLAAKFPNDKRITLLLRLVRLKGANKAAPTNPATKKTKTKSKAPVAKTTAATAGNRELISQEGINSIRVYEYNFSASPRPAVRIPREVLDEFMTKFKGERYTDADGNERAIPKTRTEQNKFFALRGSKSWQQLDAIMYFGRSGAREYYSKIEVLGDPPALKAFKTTAYRYVTNYFRSNFGDGAAVEGLYLFQGNTVEQVYSNFYILSQFKDESGRRMINRDQPEQSLLLQWGLPRSKATYPAPEIKGWKPTFTGTESKQFQTIAAWIRTLYVPAPNYDVTYELPPKVVEKKTP